MYQALSKMEQKQNEWKWSDPRIYSPTENKTNVSLKWLFVTVARVSGIHVLFSGYSEPVPIHNGRIDFKGQNETCLCFYKQIFNIFWTCELSL